MKALIGAVVLAGTVQGAMVWLLLDLRQRVTDVAANMPSGETGQPRWADDLIRDASQAARDSATAADEARSAHEEAEHAAKSAKEACDRLDGIFC